MSEDVKPYTTKEIEHARRFYDERDAEYIESCPGKSSAEIAENQRRWLATLAAAERERDEARENAAYWEAQVDTDQACYFERDVLADRVRALEGGLRDMCSDAETLNDILDRNPDAPSMDWKIIDAARTLISSPAEEAEPEGLIHANDKGALLAKKLHDATEDAEPCETCVFTRLVCRDCGTLGNDAHSDECEFDGTVWPEQCEPCPHCTKETER